MVMYFHEAICHAEKLVLYGQCQGHCEGLYNRNIIFIVFETVGPLATKLDLIVQHHKLECPVEKWDYCIQRQAQSKSSKC